MSTFESQDFATAVNLFTEAVHEWTHQGNAEAAAELADKVEAYREKLPEDLVRRFDLQLGEAHFAAGTAENGSLERAQEVLQRVANASTVELPAADHTMLEEERRQFAERFHALDRLADVALANGQFAEAAQRYAEANDARGPVDGPFPEQEARAGTTYGEAAAAFAQGDTETCQGKVEEALQFLTGKEAMETDLLASIQNLEVAAGTLEQLDRNERERVVQAIQEALVEHGGSVGGVKHTNFREIAEVAIIEVRENPA